MSEKEMDRAWYAAAKCQHVPVGACLTCIGASLAAAEERGRRAGIEAMQLGTCREAPNHTVCIGWPTIRRVAAEGGVYFADSDVALVAADDLFRCEFAPVPLPLVQRILAALERDIWTDLAAELRAIVERKP